MSQKAPKPAAASRSEQDLVGPATGTTSSNAKRKQSFGFGLFRSKGIDETAVDEVPIVAAESRTLVVAVDQAPAAFDGGSFLPEEAWRSENVDRIQRTTVYVENSPPFQRYEKKLPPRYLEEDVSAVSHDEFLSSRLVDKVRVSLGIISLLVPIPLLLEGDQSYQCIYIVITLSLLWLLRPVPLAVSAFFPVVALPLTGIMTTSSTCSYYFNESILLCLVSSLLSAATQEQCFQKRITLILLRKLGGRIRRTLFILMLSSAFWASVMSGPAAAAVLLPIGEGIVKEYKRRLQAEQDLSARNKDGSKISAEDISCGDVTADNIRRTFNIGVVLSAICGAPCGLVGAPANLFLQGFLDMQGYEDVVTYSKWMTVNVVTLLVDVIAIWLFLVYIYMKKLECKVTNPEAMNAALQATYSSHLGKLKLEEFVVGLAFFALLPLCFFRGPYFMNGWPHQLSIDQWVGDETPPLFVVLFLFVVAASPAFSRLQRFASWNLVQNAVPWSTLLIMGAGFALNGAMQKTFMVSFLSVQSKRKLKLSQSLVQVCLTVVVSVVAELRGGVALVSVVLPFALKTTEAYHWHPLSVLVPVTVSSSIALFSSVTSPAHNLLLATERINLSSLALSGVFVHVVSVATIITVTNTIGRTVFDLGNVPPKGLA